MPDSDLVLNVRQIAGYQALTTAPPAGSILLQTSGLGSAYASISPAALVSTALSTGGDMAIAGGLAAQTVQAGSAQFSNAAINMLSAQQACVGNLSAAFGTIAGSPIATTDFVSGLIANTVWSFEGRRGDVCLQIHDILRAGGAPLFSPVFGGFPRAPTPSASSNSTRLATTEFVQRNSVLYIDNLLETHPFVFSFNGRSGDVVLTGADITAAGADLGYAPLDSPNFSGEPTAPTASPGTQTGQLATTAFVMNAVQDSTTGVASFNGRTGIVTLSATDVTGAGGAPLANPAFTGTPQAPTAVPGTNSGQIATTAFVMDALASEGGVTSWNTRTGAVTLTLADITGIGGAPLASPAFGGSPSAPTAAPGTSTTQLATCAFVAAALTGLVSTFNGRSGAVTLLANDVSAVGGLLNPSPGLTGVPTAPTASVGTNTPQIATCAFVQAALSAAVAGVSSFNTRTGAVTLSNGDVIAVLPAGTAAPLMDGTASAGSATTWSRSDHVHPTDTSRYSASNPSGFQTAAQVSTALAAYLPLSGGTLTGTLQGAGATFTGVVGGTTFAASSNGGTSNFYNVTITGNLTQSTGTSWFTYFASPDNTPAGQFNNVNSINYTPGTGLIGECGPNPAFSGNRLGSNGTVMNMLQGGTVCGSITVADAATTSFNTSSDARLKTDDKPFDAGPYLDQIAVYDFRFRSGGGRRHGVMAQEVDGVYPEAVFHDDASDWWGVDYSKFVPLLLQEVKSLRARVAQLEAA